MRLSHMLYGKASHLFLVRDLGNQDSELDLNSELLDNNDLFDNLGRRLLKRGGGGKMGGGSRISGGAGFDDDGDDDDDAAEGGSKGGGSGVAAFYIILFFVVIALLYILIRRRLQKILHKVSTTPEDKLTPRELKHKQRFNKYPILLTIFRLKRPEPSISDPPNKAPDYVPGAKAGGQVAAVHAEQGKVHPIPNQVPNGVPTAHATQPPNLHPPTSNHVHYVHPQVAPNQPPPTFQATHPPQPFPTPYPSSHAHGVPTNLSYAIPAFQADQTPQPYPAPAIPANVHGAPHYPPAPHGTF